MKEQFHIGERVQVWDEEEYVPIGWGEVIQKIPQNGDYLYVVRMDDGSIRKTTWLWLVYEDYVYIISRQLEDDAIRWDIDSSPYASNMRLDPAWLRRKGKEKS